MSDNFFNDDIPPHVEDEKFRAFAERLAGALRPLWQHDLNNMEQRLNLTRKADVESAVLDVMGIETSQKQEYKDMNQGNMRSRRRRKVFRGRIVDTVDEGFWRGVRYLFFGLIGSLAFSFATHYFPAWLLALVPKL